MKREIEKLVKSITPPVALSLYRRLRDGRRFGGDFATWEDACAASVGYDSGVIVEKVRQALLQVRGGEAAFERDGVLFRRDDYWWPLLAGLLWVASCNGNRLNLLDFGGSLGTIYHQYRKFFSQLDELSWSVVEQQGFVETGRREFEDSHLRFFTAIDTCLEERHPDAILFSGVLQYLERPYEVLADAVSRDFRQILIDRTPFLTAGGRDRLTVQRVAPEYVSSYPAWFFDRERFLAVFSDRYELVAGFDSFDPFPPGIPAVSQGFLFRMKPERETATAGNPPGGETP